MPRRNWVNHTYRPYFQPYRPYFQPYRPLPYSLLPYTWDETRRHNPFHPSYLPYLPPNGLDYLGNERGGVGTLQAPLGAHLNSPPHPYVLSGNVI